MNPNPCKTKNLEIFKFTGFKDGFKEHCKNGNIEIVKYLCETFKDIKMNKINCYFGFMLACEKGHIKVVKYLCETFKYI